LNTTGPWGVGGVQGAAQLQAGITSVILTFMKTAISLPDPLFEAAERIAKRLGLSRSELYASALAQYVKKHSRKGVTAILDDVYGEHPEDSELDRRLKKAQTRSLADEDER